MRQYEADQPVRGGPAVLLELAARWAAVAVAVSVHNLYVRFRSSPSAPPGAAGSPTAEDAAAAIAARRLRPVRAAGSFRRRGTAVQGEERSRQLWDHRRQGVDHHQRRSRLLRSFARAEPGSRGCVADLLAPGGADGLSVRQTRREVRPAQGVPTTTANWDEAPVLEPAGWIEHRRPKDYEIAFSALDSGGLGHRRMRDRGWPRPRWTRPSTLRQRASDLRPQDRRPPGARILLLADMAAAVDSARAPYLDAASRRDSGPAPYSRPGQRGQAGGHRRRDEGHHRRRPGVRRRGLHPRLSASSATCAKPRSRRSSRAPTRFDT